MFEDLIGKCSVNLNEKCASTGNFYAEKFNLLNDFVNISFKTIEGLTNQQAFYQVNNTTYKLNKEGLELVFNYCIENDSVTYSRLFKKLFNTTIENVSGYRTNDNNKPEFSTMNIYHSIKKAFIEKNANTDIFKEENINQYNAIINYMGIVPGNVELINMLSGEFSLSKAEEDALKAAMKTNKPKLEYHSLSEETLKMAINDMQKDCLNYMQVYKKYDYGKKSREEFINRYTKFNVKKDFPMVNPKLIDDIIASPQVKKTLRQAIKVINAIIEEKESLPYSISIESTKEGMNSNKKKQEYIKVQKLKTELHKKAEEYLKSHNLNITNKNIEKVMLWDEFEGHCAYCNEQISKEKFINEDYEIEHILPISASFDNSYENRTIACENCNNNKCKGNKTPLQYLVGGEREAFIKRIEANKKISDLKKRNFLYADDLNKYKTRFFNRNLRDTAYATKEIVKQIKIFNDYLKNVYNKDTRILTLSTPGQFTSSIRKRYDLEKDRDAGEKPYHHAVDASIIALLPTTKLGKDIIKFQNDAKFFLNPKADDMMKDIGYEMNTYHESKEDIEYDKYIVDFKKITDTNKELFKYSGEVNKEANRSLSDALIKKVIYQGDNYYKINQVDNIYEAKINKKLFDKLFDDSKNDTLLCQDANINLYNHLKEIYTKYKTFDNPFLEYCLEINNLTLEDKFDYLKHGIRSANKGPIIRKLRYYTAINDPYFLEKKNINKKENTLIALDGLSQVCTRVYYNETKNCFAFLPIPAICTNLKKGKINKNHRLYKQYYDKLIGEDKVRHIVDLYNGNTIEVYKKSGEIIRGEVSYYDKTEKRIVLKKKNNENSPKKFIKNDYKLIVYDIDPLGNEKIRLTFEIK